MKKLFIACALVSVASASFAQATKPVNATATQATRQNGPSAEQMAEKQARVLEKQLNLTPDQYKTVYAAQLDYIRQMQAMQGQQMGEGQAMQMRMGRDQKITSVLNDEQKGKYNAMANPAHGVPANQKH